MAEGKETLTGLASILSDLTASAIEPILAEKKLGFATFDLLAAVRAAEGRETQTQIAARLGIAPSSLAEAISGAVKKNLVEQLVVANNMRARRLMLTREGEALLDACLSKVDAVESAISGALSTSEIEQTAASLRKAIDAVNGSEAG